MTIDMKSCIIGNGDLALQSRPARPFGSLQIACRFSHRFYRFMKTYLPIFRYIGLLALLANFTVEAIAQAENEPVESSNLWFYVMSVIAVGGLITAFYYWRQSKLFIEKPDYNYTVRYDNSYSNGGHEMEGVDAEKELEWLRKVKRSTSKPSSNGSGTGKVSAPLASGGSTVTLDDMSLDTKVFQEKMRRMQYTQLPINSFSQLAPVKKYQPLPLSDDPSLLTAIEQANEEYEEDESIRDLAVRILTAFRNRNSIDALSQIALYDLSSSLRSKAVMTLADFDHESVFETILLACADPTREVRAAAARGLFRLGFDRAHAWKRIIEANDVFRMSHAARAAIESGIVTKSLDRLVHEDVKIAYEAFALVSLLIKSGETDTIFDALRNHKDERVKFALLHVLKVHRDERTLDELNKIRVESSWPTDLADRMRETAKSFEQVAV